MQKWEDRVKHAHAQHGDAHQDELASNAPAEVSPEEAALVALKKWASTGRKGRQALKRANPAAVEEMELHYLQFLRQVVSCLAATVTVHYILSTHASTDHNLSFLLLMTPVRIILLPAVLTANYCWQTTGDACGRRLLLIMSCWLAYDRKCGNAKGKCSCRGRQKVSWCWS